MESDAQIGEIIDMCKPMRDAAVDSADHMTDGCGYVVDWFAETLGGKTA